MLNIYSGLHPLIKELYLPSREYVIHGSKIHIESGYILLTLELRVKRLRRFDLPPADLLEADRNVAIVSPSVPK